VLLTRSHFVYHACCRWTELRTNMHNIEKVKAMLEGQDVKYRHHIGGAVYVSVMTGYYRCVDFWKFFVPDGSRCCSAQSVVLYALFECNSMEGDLTDSELVAYVENMESYVQASLWCCDELTDDIRHLKG